MICETYLDYVNQVNPDNFKSYFVKNKDDIEKIIQYYLEKNDSESYLILGMLYKEGTIFKKDYEKAKEYLEKSNTPKGFNNLGLIYKEEQDYEKSEECYLKAFDSGYINASVNLASLYEDLRKPEETLKYAFIAYENKIHIPGMCNIIGSVYARKKDWANAEKYFLEAIENGHIYAMHNYAHVCFELRNFVGAIKYFEMYIKKTKNNRPLVQIGEIYEMMKIYKVAKSYYLKASEYKYPEAFYRLASVYERIDGDIDNAIKYYKEAAYYGFDCNERIEFLEKISKSQ